MKEQRKGVLRREVHDQGPKRRLKFQGEWREDGEGELSWETGTGQVSIGFGTDCHWEFRTNKGPLTGFNSRILRLGLVF